MENRAPDGIITDQCKAMKNVIVVVFPNTRHHTCLWHIMKKVPEKLGGLTMYKTIKNALKQLVYESTSTINFELGWEQFISSFNLHHNEWLSTLYAERSRWVPCYLKSQFWAGMSTTQRSESMNVFFDGLINSTTT